MTELRTSRSWLWLTGLVLATAFAIFGYQMSQPPPAQAQGLIDIIPSPCVLLPDGAAEDTCDSVTGTSGDDLIGEIPGVPRPSEVLKDAAAAAAEVIVEPVLKGLKAAAAASTAYLIRNQMELVGRDNTPGLNEEWYLQAYGPVAGIALLIGAVAVFWRLLMAAKNIDAPDLGAAALAFIVFLATITVLPPMADMAVHITDKEVAPGILNIAGDRVEERLDRLEEDFSNSAAPPLIAFGYLLAATFGGMLTQILLVIREIMLYAVTAAIPLAFAWQIAGRRDSNSLLDKAVLSFIGLLLIPPFLAFLTLISILMSFGNADLEPVLLSVLLLGAAPFIAIVGYRAWTGQNIRFIPVGSLVTHKILNRL